MGGHERVLGMGVDEVYEMLTDLIAAHRITLEELEAAVASVDRDGAAVWLSQQPQEIEALWRRRDATSTRMLRAMHDAVAASGDTFRTFGTSMLPLGFVPEWYTEDLVGHAEFRSLVGERLSKRSALLIGFALLSFVLYFIAFRVLDSFSLSMECVWVSLYLLPICTEALVACALYPSDLTTQSAQRYMLVILWLKNLLTWLTIYDEWPRQSPSKSPSYQFNRVGMILSSVTNLTGILLTVTGRYTWRLRRALELLESVQTTACIAIQAHLGHAADGYYPGLQRCCASLYGALLCCLLPLVMNTLAMRPESRRRISAWSIRLGLNHVCIKLRDVPPAQLRLESSGGTSCGFSSCPCSSTHKGGGSDVQWGTLGQAGTTRRGERCIPARWRKLTSSRPTNAALASLFNPTAPLPTTAIRRLC